MFLFLKKTWKIGLSILFGVAVLLFWGSVYPAHISYQEQFQLFLFDADYWWERIVVPGGLADYIAEYLTQFYYCLLYTSPSPRDRQKSRMPSSA